MFTALAATLWIALIAMAIWQYNVDHEYKREQIYQELTDVSQLIINAYERNYAPLPFIDFVAHNYSTNPVYADMRISVYLDGSPFYNVGPLIPDTPTDEMSRGYILVSDRLPSSAPDEPDRFFFSQQQSGDSRLNVYIDVPNTDKITAATMPNLRGYLVFFVLAVLLTIGAYISTRLQDRSIQRLRTFAVRAAANPGSVPEMEFVHDELGDVSRMIAQVLTERQYAADRLRREHDRTMLEMEERSRQKRQLTSNINHELKTPIGVIKGYLDTIVQNPDMDSATRQHFTAKALEHADRLVSLINDFSSMSRLEEGANVISTETVDFHDLAVSLDMEIRESGEVAPLKFKFDVPPGTKVDINYTLITAMLHNLAKNAAAYSKGTECGVSYLRTDDKFCHFIFYDNGRGVPEAHLPHLFERFYRIDAGRARKSGGTGLGLAIVQNTITAHGGTISVANRREGGLIYTFTLPRG